MNMKNNQNNLSPNETIGLSVVQNADGTESYESHTPDGYDEHLIPAETAARKEREGDHFKHLPKYSTGSEHLETSGGTQVDKEGLMDNFALEPEMYYETRGDVPSPASEKREAKQHQVELQQAAIQAEALQQQKLHLAFIREEKLRQDEIYQENLRLEAVSQENIHKETAHQENMYQEELRKEKLNQDAMDQEEQRQQMMDQETCHQEEMVQEEFRHDEIHQDIVDQENVQGNGDRQNDLHEHEPHPEKPHLQPLPQAEIFNVDQSPENILKERNMSSTKLGVGTFADDETVFSALAALKAEKFVMAQVSVVGHNVREQLAATGANTSDRLVDAGNLHTDDNKAGGTAVDGAIAGGAVGSFAGLLIGLGLLTIPGVGPVLLAGGATATAIATALSGGAIGAAAGSLAGGLVGLGIPADQAEVYAKHVDRGDYLVLVEGTQTDIEVAHDVLSNHHLHGWYVYDLPNEAVGNVPVTAIS